MSLELPDAACSLEGLGPEDWAIDVFVERAVSKYCFWAIRCMRRRCDLLIAVPAPELCKLPSPSLSD
eukprot:5552377-Pyramimonas_sp.AAC.1